MKATKPPRETVSSLNYRDAEETPTTTHPDLTGLAVAALAILRRDGKTSTAEDGEAGWEADIPAEGGRAHPLRIACTGPDIPDGIPGETAHPSVIPFERPWVGTYRLSVHAPLVVLDIYWRTDQPLRIMGFSRGDWEPELQEVAG